jgi:GT2 family glycosyltransferase
MPELSIVIVNYNTRDELARCLRSIQAHSEGINVETIVVDNASRDGSAAMVQAEFGDVVTLIEPGHNTWFSGGNNLGVAAATGDYVLILNPDTQFPPGTLPAMLAYSRSHPEVGALTCRMTFPDGRLQHTCSRAPRYSDLLLGYTFLGVLLRPWRDKGRERMWYRGWERDTTRAVEVIPGSNILAPRALLAELGPFDETYRLYFTEDDICRRILGRGYEIHFLAEATLLHDEHASTSQVQRLASQVYFDDLLVYARKWNGAPRAWLLRMLMAPTRWGMDLAQRLRGEKASL